MNDDQWTQTLMATQQQQELALQRQQLEDQRRTNAAALERLDAILARLMDRLDNLEAA